MSKPVDIKGYVSYLQGCARQCLYRKGQSIHAHLRTLGFSSNIILHNSLLNMYTKCGNMEDARQLFEESHKRDVYSWSSVISGYARQGPEGEALTLYHSMKMMECDPNDFILASLLHACGGIHDEGYSCQQVHADAVKLGFERNVPVSNALLDAYAKCSRLNDARQVFEEMPLKNVVSWTTMIAGFASMENDYSEDALRVFEEMRDYMQPNPLTFAAVLPAIGKIKALDQGAIIHSEIIVKGFQFNIIIMTALMDMYFKCGKVFEARKLFSQMLERSRVSWNVLLAGLMQNGCIKEAMDIFEKIPKRDLVSWNTLIAGLAQNGHGEEILMVFTEMESMGLRPDSLTLSSLVAACPLDQGVQIHSKCVKSGFLWRVSVLNSFIYMYAKCGNLWTARSLFDCIPERDIVTWTSMISGYAMHGHAEEVLCLLHKMKICGLRPNDVTFLSILSACSHCGLVQEGYQCFELMTDFYGIKPSMEHYCCMVDLLGRSGRLNEAQDFINRLPIKVNASVWRCLLAACVTWGNLKRGELAAQQVFELQPGDSTTYVLLSNMYAAVDQWSDRGYVSIKKTHNMKPL